MKNLKLNMADRYPDYVLLPLVDREAMRKAVKEKFGTVKAFVAETGFKDFSNITSGHRRVCPKKLAKMKKALGV